MAPFSASHFRLHRGYQQFPKPGKQMASFCRSAIMAGSRSLAYRSKTLNLKRLTSKPMSSPFSSPSTRAVPCASRMVSVLGALESMMPLHSAIASARLQSSIALESSIWSWLSQGLATPL